MPVVGTGIIDEVVSGMQAMLSNSVTFQKLVQAPTQAAALALIKKFGNKGALARPFAVVNWSPGGRWDVNSGGTRNYYKGSGGLIVNLEVDVAMSGTITGATSGSVFTASGLAGFADSYFNGQVVEFTSGANAVNPPVTKEISGFVGASGQITLLNPFGSAPAIGDTFKIYGATTQDIETAFTNSLAGIIADLQALSGSQSGAFPNINIIDCTDWGHIKEDAGQEDYCGAWLKLEYGL